MHFTHADSMKASELAHLPALRLPAGVTCSAFAFRDGTSCAQPAAASARATRAGAEARTLLTSAASGRDFRPRRAPGAAPTRSAPALRGRPPEPTRAP